MSRGSDQVFQLSLTEIAFTIAFMLLLLLGYMIFMQRDKVEQADQFLQDSRGIEQQQEALERVKEELTTAMRDAGATNSDEMLSRLVDTGSLRQERDRLLQKFEDLEEQISALTELKQQLEDATSSNVTKTTLDEAIAALALQAGVKEILQSESEMVPQGAGPDALEAVRSAMHAAKALRGEMQTRLGTTVAPGGEEAAIRQLVRSAAESAEVAVSVEAAGKENSDLRGQIAFLRNGLDARGGRDYPPCWADEAGKVEFLLNIELGPDVVQVTPGWPPARESDARALPGIAEVLSAAAPLEVFAGRVQGIFDWSKRQDPQCRHYVRLKSSIPDAIQSDRARLAIESFFYKVEVRR
jgi:hypothetical protein